MCWRGLHFVLPKLLLPGLTRDVLLAVIPLTVRQYFTILLMTRLLDEGEIFCYAYKLFFFGLQQLQILPDCGGQVAPMAAPDIVCV